MQIATAERRLCCQSPIGPNGVADHENALTLRAISESPNQSRTGLVPARVRSPMLVVMMQPPGRRPESYAAPRGCRRKAYTPENGQGRGRDAGGRTFALGRLDQRTSRASRRELVDASTPAPQGRVEEGRGD